MALQPSKSFHFPRPVAITLLLTLAALHLSASPAVLAAQTEWKTGDDFRKQLESPISLIWESRSLREGLDRLSQSHRIAIYLDRRVDPNQQVTCSANDEALESVLRRIARPLGLGVGHVGSVVYIGPPLTSVRIATLAQVRNEQIQELPVAARKRLLRRQPTGWAELDNPRLIFTRMATHAGLTVPNVQAIPHDVWRAASFPDLTFAEQATLVLSGFDISFRWHKNAREIYLSQFPSAVSIERSYPHANPAEYAKELKSLLPQAFLRVEQDKVVVGSLLEDHWKIEKLRDPRSSDDHLDPTDPKYKRYTLKVTTKPTATLLRQITKVLNLELVVDEKTPRENLEKLISFSVVEATSAEVIQAIAKAAELEARFEDGKVYISKPAGAPAPASR